ncbi:MAG: hypothetical protein NUW37_16260 [Planctomycetes bacterium]|nr:hypothetical protein [Planctomycetota bacterium]
MATFSRRMGLKQFNKPLQIESMDDDLRNSLWTILNESLLQPAKLEHALKFNENIIRSLHGLSEIRGTNLWSFARMLWMYLLKKPTDDIPDTLNNFIAKIRKFYFSSECTWSDVYEFIEISIQTFPTISGGKAKNEYINALNVILAREFSGYRVVEDQFVPIVDECEILSIEDVFKLPKKYASVEEHFRKALGFLSDREDRDEHNSMKEAILSIESLAQLVTGKLGATLGNLAKELHLHPALESALGKIYGYTSDEGGIRHAAIDDTDIDPDLAKFFLVSCSAFINYIISQNSK